MEEQSPQPEIIQTISTWTHIKQSKITWLVVGAIGTGILTVIMMTVFTQPKEITKEVVVEKKVEVEKEEQKVVSQFNNNLYYKDEDTTGRAGIFFKYEDSSLPPEYKESAPLLVKRLGSIKNTVMNGGLPEFKETELGNITLLTKTPDGDLGGWFADDVFIDTVGEGELLVEIYRSGDKNIFIGKEGDLVWVSLEKENKCYVIEDGFSSCVNFGEQAIVSGIAKTGKKTDDFMKELNIACVDTQPQQGLDIDTDICYKEKVALVYKGISKDVSEVFFVVEHTYEDKSKDESWYAFNIETKEITPTTPKVEMLQIK